MRAMIKTYIPNALMRAAADIAKAHPIEQETQALSDAGLRTLLDKIQKCPTDQLPMFAWTLVSKHLIALCKYLPHNRYNKPIDKIMTVVSTRMEPKYYGELFHQWQKYPDGRHILRLLAQYDTDEYRPEDMLIPSGHFKEWLQSGNVYREINKYVSKAGGKHGIYRDRMEQSGFHGNTPLYSACFTEYLTSCSMSQLVLEGDDAVSAAAKKGTTEQTELILLNLLICGERDRTSLKRFPECFALMKSLWKEPYGGRFPKNQETAQKVYHWLCNYVEMMNGFMLDADPRRRDFWEKYLDTCEVNRIKTHRMMIFYYKYDCAIEFEQVGLIYIFDKTYFKNTVLPTIINKSTQEAKSWLRNNSHPLYSRSHQGRWELEAAVEMRKII